MEALSGVVLDAVLRGLVRVVDRDGQVWWVSPQSVPWYVAVSTKVTPTEKSSPSV